ncbi:Synaptosomal-associated protein 25-A [Pseudolycoriella hygida]|uniref:Synaptosomal-associated protein 25-A n=1 Tax=Pseudolycoriella hygida TaxID=35572 RepID=A0A9Q0NCE5_9DIPT|nr:Synaptosomal-associated protein 25-A [Pseudolycoriella hygida]
MASNELTYDDPATKIDEVNARSLESTRRIRRMAEQAADVAIKTAVELAHQGEQLGKVEGQLHGINHDVKQAEKSLKRMDKFMGWFKIPKFGKQKDTVAVNDELWKTESTNEPKVTKREFQSQQASPQSQESGPMITQITGCEREKEMDENLSAIDGILATLKNTALDIGDELDTQNNVINKINTGMEDTNLRIQNANTLTAKLLK